MKALKLFGANDIRIVEQNMPEAGAGEVILEVKAASICGTDVRMWKNGAKGVDEQHPITLGHEMAGVIHSVGANVVCYQPGMRVTVQPNSGCGICAACLQGYNHLCEDYKAFGINFDGAFSQYVRIPAKAVTAGNLLILDEDISFEEGAVAEPLSCIYNGFEKLSARGGETALVIGAGPIGIGHAMLLDMSGVEVIMADLVLERLEMAKSFVPRLKYCLSANIEKTVAETSNNLGLDIIVVACPSPQAQEQAVRLAKIHGRVLFFGGIPASKEPVKIDTNLIHYRELMLTGSTRSSLGQTAYVLTLIKQGRLNAKGLITHNHSFDDILNAFNQVVRGQGLKHIIHFD